MDTSTNIDNFGDKCISRFEANQRMSVGLPVVIRPSRAHYSIISLRPLPLKYYNTSSEEFYLPSVEKSFLIKPPHPPLLKPLDDSGTQSRLT